MTPERFRQIEELYHAAREGTADERAALLEQADPELRREVESLLSQPDSGEHRPAIENLPEVLEDSVTLGICEHSKHNLTTKVFVARSNRAGIVSLGKGGSDSIAVRFRATAPVPRG
jgi:plasmid stabilization system protein ParE